MASQEEKREINRKIGALLEGITLPECAEILLLELAGIILQGVGPENSEEWLLSYMNEHLRSILAEIKSIKKQLAEEKQDDQ